MSRRPAEGYGWGDVQPQCLLAHRVEVGQSMELFVCEVTVCARVQNLATELILHVWMLRKEVQNA